MNLSEVYPKSGNSAFNVPTLVGRTKGQNGPRNLEAECSILAVKIPKNLQLDIHRIETAFRQGCLPCDHLLL